MEAPRIPQTCSVPFHERCESQAIVALEDFRGMLRLTRRRFRDDCDRHETAESRRSHPTGNRHLESPTPSLAGPGILRSVRLNQDGPGRGRFGRYIRFSYTRAMRPRIMSAQRGIRSARTHPVVTPWKHLSTRSSHSPLSSAMASLLGKRFDPHQMLPPTPPGILSGINTVHTTDRPESEDGHRGREEDRGDRAEHLPLPHRAVFRRCCGRR